MGGGQVKLGDVGLPGDEVGQKWDERIMLSIVQAEP